MTVTQRRLNVREAMIARPPGGSRLVWLVDDIVTTGATIDEAVRALSASGWKVAGASVVASVGRRADGVAASRMALAARHRLR